MYRSLCQRSEEVSVLGHLAAIVLITCLTGCVHINRPPIPATLDPGNQAKYSVDAFNHAYTNYQQLLQSGEYEKAKLQRDSIINRIEVDVEGNYREYEGKLSSTRATVDTLSDVTQLGLSAATGVIGNVDIKDMLAASLTAFKGSKLSFDKNFFREKTTEILISKMQASRDKVRNRITTKMALPVQQYAFEEAWRDLVEFFYSGTLQSALVQLANDAGADAAAAKKQAETIDIKRASTEEEAKLAVRIRSNFAKLYNQALKGADPNARADALKTAKDAIVVMGQGDKITDKSTPEEILNLLRTLVIDSLNHPEDIPKVDKALTPSAKEP